MDDMIEAADSLDIAVIAMAGRFPGAADVDGFWRNLVDGREAATAFTDEQYLAGGGDPAMLNDPYLVKVEAAVDGIDQFDAGFFGYRPPDAELLDPQHRVFLECAYHALEEAGYDPDRYEGAIGVYTGAVAPKYFMFNVLPHHTGRHDPIALQHASFGSSTGSLATRVSYDLNLRGPSMFVQTACSTSLVAVHLACQDLLTYRSDMVLAGGVSLNPQRHRGYRYVQDGMQSPDGTCRAFDAKAAGTFPGDGAGVVVLKRLADAIADGDHIRAVIKGTAVNNDGNRKVGFTAPSVTGQADVIVAAHTIAGVDPASIGYVEAHGTATPVGDPIEVAALTRAFEAGTRQRGFCALGSVKTNIGHLDAAAGVAGLIKTVLAVEHATLPPTLHYTAPNPLIDFDDSPFFVTDTLTTWPATPGPRRAGVSSFGIGGTNAHVVIEQAPDTPASAPPGQASLLLLSAHTPTALQQLTRDYATHLSTATDVNIADVAYTTQLGRRALAHRRAVVCRDPADAGVSLAALTSEPAPPAAGARPVVFTFPGWGPQYEHMGAELYDTQPVYRDVIDRCAAILQPTLGFDLRTALYGDPADIPVHLRRPVVFPTMVATEYAMARLLMSFGVQPRALIGHSLGEYTAACLAEVMTLEDVLPLVAERERLFGTVAAGSTVAVALSETDVKPYLGDDIALAAVNGEHMCSVAGTVHAVEDLITRLDSDGVEYHRLHIETAAHSHLLDPILDEYATAVSKITLREPTIPFISNVTGTWITGDEATDPGYWVQHTRRTVRFADGLDELRATHAPIFVEAGPGQTLTKLARRHLPAPQTTIASMRPARSGETDTAFLLAALGALWCQHLDIRWEALHDGTHRRRVPLPLYPFERQRYWIDPPTVTPDRPEQAGHDGDELVVLPTWRRGHRPPVAPTGDWLLLGTDNAGVADRLRRDGHRVIHARPAAEYLRTADDATLRPGHRGDLDTLLDDLVADGITPRSVAYLWEPDDATGFDGLNTCAAVLTDRFTGEQPIGLWVLAAGVFDVTGTEPVDPSRRLLEAACDRLRDELPAIRLILLDTGPGTLEPADLAVVARELGAGITEHVVAVRSRQRWLAADEPCPPPGDAPIPAAGVHVVIDGLAPAYLPFTRALLQAGARDLLITATTGDGQDLFDSDLLRNDITGIEYGLRERIPVDRPSPQLVSMLDDLAGRYARDYLTGAGFTAEAGTAITITDVAARLHVIPRYTTFLTALLRMLADDGFGHLHDGLFTFTRRLTAGDASTLHTEISGRYPDYQPDLQAIARCARSLHAVFTGQIDGTQVLMPDGDQDIVRPVIDNRLKSSDIAVYRPLIAETVARLATRTGGRQLRILEVGAGRGYLTWLVADAVSQLGTVDYHVTDIGRSFVLDAQREAQRRGHNFMTFGVLDISQDPIAQGYQLHDYDLVLAFNVLHATPDVRQSLDNVSRLLGRDGILMLLEATTQQRCSTLTSGLAEGWWSFDDDVRDLSPLLPSGRWLSLLDEQGYRDVIALPDQADADTDHAVVVARRAQLAGPHAALSAAAAVDLRTLRQTDATINLVAVSGSDDPVEAALAAVDGRPIASIVRSLADPHLPAALNARLDLAGRAPAHRSVQRIMLLHDRGDARTQSDGTGHYAEAWAQARHNNDDVTATVLSHDSRTDPPAAAAALLHRALHGGPAPVVRTRRRPAASPTFNAATAAAAPSLDEQTPAEPSRPAFNQRPALNTPYVAPQGPLETKIAAIWAQLLGLNQVGMHDNFYDLGGDSLIAMQLTARLRDEFSVNLSMRDLLQNPVVEATALHITEAATRPAPPTDEPITPARRRRARGGNPDPTAQPRSGDPAAPAGGQQ